MSALIHRDVMTLADLLRAEWPAARQRIRLSGHPTCEGDDDDTKDEVAGEKDDDVKDEVVDEKDGDADEKINKDDDWQAKARKHETRNKRLEREAAKAAKERDELAARIAKIDEEKLSEQEKAIKAAREEAVSEVTTKYEAEKRSDRIENAVTKLSLRGFKAKDKDGNETTLRFADPDDAQLRIDRALSRGDLAYEDIYADGKVDQGAVTTFLTDLLEEHPRLRAPDANGTGNGGAKTVDFGGGKGKGGSGKTLEEMTPDDHLKDLNAA